MGRVPRRLRRFQRGGETLEDWGSTELDEPLGQQPGKNEASKEIVTQLALDEVQRFKKKHQRLPKKKEYDSIAESIYAQLKDQEQRKKIMERLEGRKPENVPPSERARQRKAGRREGRQALEGKAAGAEGIKESTFAKMQKAARGLSEKEIEGLSVEDIFGEKEAPGEKKPGQREPEEKFGLGELENFGEEAETGPQKCPACGTAAEDIIFCPECGTAFCKKCAKGIEKLGLTKTFVCPECGEKIKR